MAARSESTPSVTVKAQLRDELRRFSLPLAPAPTWAMLRAQLTRLFGGGGGGGDGGEGALRVKYRDDDGAPPAQCLCSHALPSLAPRSAASDALLCGSSALLRFL